MSLNDLDIQSVRYNRPRVIRSPTQNSFEAQNGRLIHPDVRLDSDASSDTTVLRWSTPPESPNHSTDDLTSRVAVRPARHHASAIAMNDRDAQPIHTVPLQAAASKQELPSLAHAMTCDSMADYDNPPTPGNDDTLYIRYAIDLLTRDGEHHRSWPTTETSVVSYPVERILPDEGLGYIHTVRKARGDENPPKPSSKVQAEIKAEAKAPQIYLPFDTPPNSTRYPSLTYLPTLLRPLSMTILMILCLLMIACLMTSAIYSATRSGLVGYASNFLGAQYFLFRFVPQIFGALLMIYIEAILMAMGRIVPYSMMAKQSNQTRKHAAFIGLYSHAIYCPRFDLLRSGEPMIGICTLFLWPITLSISLHSSLFSASPINGEWRWTVVQGVAWTLVAFYIFAILALLGIFFWSRRQQSGLLWDPRCLADIMAMLPRSNNLDDYADSEIVTTKNELQNRMPERSDRLGYWSTPKSEPDIFYCIGEEGTHTRRYVMQEGQVVQEKQEKPTGNTRLGYDMKSPSPKNIVARGTNSSLMAKVYSPEIRFRYLPWSLRETFLLLWPVAGFVLYLALLIISFLPSTSLSGGFLPQLPAIPNGKGFSSAEFLYSFIPSLIGLMIYFAFQSFARTIARLTPWVELSNSDGVVAKRSILLDYAYSLAIPFATTLTGIRNRHYTMAILSIMLPLLLVVPILAGGIFFPLAAQPSNTVFMYTSFAAYYIMLVILGLLLITLVVIPVTILRGRHRSWYLPHPVTCIAEILSFLYSSDIIHDAAFQAVRSKKDLEQRLVAPKRSSRSAGLTGGAKDAEQRFFLGIIKGKDGRSHLGIDRLGRGASRDGVGRSRRGHGRSQSRFSL